MNAPMRLGRGLATLATTAALAAGALAFAAPTAEAAPFKACGETWTSYYNPGSQGSLYKVNVWFKSASGGIKFCVQMVALKNPKGRVMTIKTTKPSKTTKSTKGGSLYVIKTVRAGDALTGQASFTYTNPAYPSGKRTVTSKFNFPVT